MLPTFLKKCNAVVPLLFRNALEVLTSLNCTMSNQVQPGPFHRADRSWDFEAFGPMEEAGAARTVF